MAHAEGETSLRVWTHSLDAGGEPAPFVVELAEESRRAMAPVA